MAIKHYGWRLGESPPEIGPHSLAKHRILREYVQEYIHVLTARPGGDVLRITLVDGFAGGGEYADPRQKNVACPGSPLILMDAVRAAEAAVNVSRRKPIKVDARYVFVEQDHAVAEYLGDVLRKRGDHPREDGVVRLLQGTFDSHLDKIIESIQSRGRARRAIFVLDQYGYTDVPASTLARIFKELPNAEVFLTLAVGWMTAYLTDCQAAGERLGLSPEMVSQVLAAGEALNAGEAVRQPVMLAIQRLLHDGLTAEAGSRFYTPFFIVSRESNRPYWLLHMANNWRAHDVVKTLHWGVENHFQHYGAAGLTMLGYDPQADVEYTDQLGFQFDNAARARTLAALMTDLPPRIASRSGVLTFDRLHQDVCNETPATRDLLAEAVRRLCMEGELVKRGGEGERRAPSTAPHAKDILSIARQGALRF